MNPATLAAEYQRIKAALLADYPELAGDEQALADTLEGETGAIDAVAGLIRSAQETEAMAEALEAMIKERQTRKGNMEERAKRLRKAACSIMSAAGIRKVTRPDFTAFLKPIPWGVRVDFPEAVPDSMCRITKEPDKTKIKAEYVAGRDVAGVSKTNGGETLQINVK